MIYFFYVLITHHGKGLYLYEYELLNHIELILTITNDNIIKKKNINQNLKIEINKS